MKRLIVYDLDGTLADTRRDISRAANHMRAELNLAPLQEREICRFVGLGLQRLVEHCLGTEDPAEVDRGMRIYRAFYGEHLLDHTVLYPGVPEVLEHFKGRDQAVVTNKPDPYSRQILEGLGVARYFLEVIAGNSGYPKKPDPEALLALMRREGNSAQEVLLIGDSPVDMETGARADVMTVAVAHGFSERAELEAARPGRMCGDFTELLALAKREGW